MLSIVNLFCGFSWLFFACYRPPTQYVDSIPSAPVLQRMPSTQAASLAASPLTSQHIPSLLPAPPARPSRSDFTEHARSVCHQNCRQERALQGANCDELRRARTRIPKTLAVANTCASFDRASFKKKKEGVMKPVPGCLYPDGPKREEHP